MQEALGVHRSEPFEDRLHQHQRLALWQPTARRLKLGLDSGAELELSEESDGVRLRVVRAKPRTDIEALAGLVTAPSRGRPRRLEEFDPASLLARGRSDES